MSFDWTTFYANVSGRHPRPLLLDVVARAGRVPDGVTRTAIDLGCGDGTETAVLLTHGWHVLAIDSEPAAFEHLHAKIPPAAQARLSTQVAAFETVTLTLADLIYAGYSLPFCAPQAFPALWTTIVQNIVPGGRFAGQLFGVNDTWATNPAMTFLTAAQARALFDGFDLEHFEEEDADGNSTGGPKHWHAFHIIARKRDTMP